MLMGFRMSRSTISQKADPMSRDYRYFVEKGWPESDYYFPTRLGVLKKALGKLFDRMAPAILKMIAKSHPLSPIVRYHLKPGRPRPTS